MMRARRKMGLRVALQADAVSLGAQARGVRLVAIAAGHALGVHPALHERAVLVDFVADLAVGLVEARLEQCREVGVRQRLAARRLLRELAAPRVAARAGVDL